MTQTKVRGTIAKVALSAALAGAMTLGGVVAPTGVALANTVTVSNPGSGTYDFYQVFNGDVTYDQEKSAYVPGNMSWSTDAIRNQVTVFLLANATNGGWDANGNSVSDYSEWLQERGLIQSAEAGPTTQEQTEAYNANNVISFIAPLIQADEQAGRSVPAQQGAINSGKNVTQANTFTNALAKAVEAAQASQSAATNWAGAAAGYILVVPKDSSDGSTPVWVANTGSGEIKITRKEGLPTLLKEVKDENDGAFAKIADVDGADKIVFQLTVTIPSGGTGEVNIQDTLSSGLSYVSGSATVTQPDSGVDVTASANGQTLTLAFTPTANVTDYIITYEAKLNGNATKGATTNSNSAILTYNNQSTVANVAKVATYQLDFSKVDENNAPLAGAKFAIMKGEQYVQQDGSVGSSEHYFAVDNQGKLAVPFFVDADTYTIKEQAPSGYAPVSDFTITITSELDTEMGEVTSLDATASNVLVTVDKDVATGVIAVTVPNEQSVILPITGMTPSQLGTVVGLLLVATGTVIVIRRRHQSARA